MAMYNSNDREFSFEIVETIGVIAEHSTGWKKELSIVSWNGGAPKYDIRDWDPYHEHMSKGITLHEKEMQRVVELLCKKKHMGKNGQGVGASDASGAPPMASACAAAPDYETTFDAPLPDVEDKALPDMPPPAMQDDTLPDIPPPAETDSVPFA